MFGAWGSLDKKKSLACQITCLFNKLSKSVIFLVKLFLGNFYRHLAIFPGHTAYYLYLNCHTFYKINLLLALRYQLGND